MILLPDDWDESYYMLNHTNDDGYGFYNNRITAVDWGINLEAHGAVFLPAAGYRDGTSIYSELGEYWSTSVYYDSNGSGLTLHTVCNVFFNSSQFNTDPSWLDSRYRGESVRLVYPR